mgnify:FL=1|jgi:hypothetical protein
MGYDKVEDVLYKAYNEGIRDKVLKVSTKLEGSYYSYGDKIEKAYNIVKESEEIKLWKKTKKYSKVKRSQG